MDVFRVGRRDGEVMGREARIETHEKCQRGVGWEFSRRRKLYWDVLRVAVAKGCKDDGAFRTVAQVESAPGRVRVEVFDFARREEFSDDE
jgi:hypothetical protein